MEIDEQHLKNEIENFKASFCPYGYLDIQRAVREAIEIGEDGDWAFGQLEEFADSCGMKVTDLDPCYVVMDSILQIARNEIEELSGFDLQNDANFETYGNFCATTYDWKSEDIENLSQVLRVNSYKLENLSDATRYWLTQVEIDLDSLIGEQ